MAHFRKIPGIDDAGYDDRRYLQVVPVGRTTRVFLVAGSDLSAAIDDESIAALSDKGESKTAKKNASLSSWEKEQSLRELVIKGVSPGSTKLRAKWGSSDWSKPLDVVVVDNLDSRRCGTTAASVSRHLHDEIRGKSLREAVLIVAEDQMNSAVARTSGFGRYHSNASYDWCGAFAHWCWKMAAAIKGEDHPFGEGSDKLLSPQKAISWAMQDATPAQLLRYKGHDPFLGGKKLQEYREIGYNGYQLEKADIVLVRKGSAGGWKHVCMVHSYSDGTLVTIDGNQGLPQSIKIRNRDSTEKLSDGSYALVYVHVIL
jgi:hypothetical protein